MKVILYAKPACSLCDEARAALGQIQKQLPFELEEKDITADPALAEKYGKRIPVIAVDGEEVSELKADPTLLAVRLAQRARPAKARRGGTPRSTKSAFTALALLAFVAVLASKGYQIFVEPEKLSLEYIAVEPMDLPAPPITLETREGKKITLADFRGQTVFLNFWATWCDSCRVEMPSMARLATDLKRPGFTMIAASVDDSWKEVDQFLGKRALDFVVFRDAGSKGADAFGTHKLPETYVIGPDGRIKAKFTGPREWNDPAFSLYFNKVLPPAPASAEGARASE
jgi:thiol-disulfide isomerase/thioredoxin